MDSEPNERSTHADGRAGTGDGSMLSAPDARASCDGDDRCRCQSRDRQRTERAIVGAVGRVLAQHGFNGLGVNAIAREAGVDKVLIYRYFGGLDELMAAYARELDFWPSVDEITAYDGEALLELPLDRRLARIIQNIVRAVYRRPLTRMILGWRLVEENELTRYLDEVRERVTTDLYARYVLPEEQEAYPHVLSTARIVGNGALYMVVGSANGAVKGEPELTGNFDRPDGWAVMDGIIERLLGGVFGEHALTAAESTPDDTPDLLRT